MGRKYNGGKWTASRFRSFIKSALRSASQRWQPKYEVLKEALVGKEINKSTGRLANHYQCNKCKKAFPLKQVQVDHIKPIIDPRKGFKTWDSVINLMFCEKDNLQVLCTDCHREKTLSERKLYGKKKSK